MPSPSTGWFATPDRYPRRERKVERKSPRRGGVQGSAAGLSDLAATDGIFGVYRLNTRRRRTADGIDPVWPVGAPLSVPARDGPVQWRIRGHIWPSTASPTRSSTTWSTPRASIHGPYVCLEAT